MKPLSATALTVLTALLLLLAFAASAETDPHSGLVTDGDWQLVLGHCGACHSHAVVRQQRGDAAFWDAAITRMQTTHGLWEIEADQRQRMVTYLSTHYGTGDGEQTHPVRRPALARALRP